MNTHDKPFNAEITLEVENRVPWLEQKHDTLVNMASFLLLIEPVLTLVANMTGSKTEKQTDMLTDRQTMVPRYILRFENKYHYIFFKFNVMIFIHLKL